ncbi:MAG: UDP-N-acetylmuramoyl-L-alanyl-D-glutamate--2,6-diaminopimelate ligase [Deltaproteobacteria bacterium]|nr:UDP-N-acetylmuramoyl-L-alanyl-D-glutamate--2,6-diaminopimelate ligase [Deltaproteobacteria bacterium]
MGVQLKELVQSAEIEEVQGNIDQQVLGLAYDSRKVKRGDVFFAIAGGQADGHDFALRALEQGAAAVVLERRLPLPEDATWVRVRHVRRTMGFWAAGFFSHPSRRLILVGVTGTNGKTTTTYLLESIFKAAGLTPGVIGTVNYRYRNQVYPAAQTTPEAVDVQALLARMVDAGVQAVAMEVSSHALAMERVRGLDFEGALFTNLTRDHLDFHETMESYFFSKSRLFTDYLRTSCKEKKCAVIHGEDPRGAQLLAMARESGLNTLSFGNGRQWDVHPIDYKSDLEGLTGKIRVKDREFSFSSRLVGAPNLENLLGAVALASAIGLPLKSIAGGIAALQSVPGRMERVENGRGFSILVDYAHTPDALDRGLQAVRPLTKGRVITVFGCGGDRDRGKRPIMGEIAARLSDLVILTSDNPRTEDPMSILQEIEQGARKTGIQKLRISDFGIRNSDLEIRKGYSVEPDRRAAIRLALRQARSEDLLLIAGKGHEDYQILGADRIHFDDREVVREELGQSAIDCER